MFRITAAVALASVPVAAQNLVTNDYELGAKQGDYFQSRQAEKFIETPHRAR
jgi:hypothetical protein